MQKQIISGKYPIKILFLFGFFFLISSQMLASEEFNVTPNGLHYRHPKPLDLQLKMGVGCFKECKKYGSCGKYGNKSFHSLNKKENEKPKCDVFLEAPKEDFPFLQKGQLSVEFEITAKWCLKEDRNIKRNIHSPGGSCPHEICDCGSNHFKDYYETISPENDIAFIIDIYRHGEILEKKTFRKNDFVFEKRENLPEQRNYRHDLIPVPSQEDGCGPDEDFCRRHRKDLYYQHGGGPFDWPYIKRAYLTHKTNVSKDIYKLKNSGPITSLGEGWFKIDITNREIEPNGHPIKYRVRSLSKNIEFSIRKITVLQSSFES